MKEVLDEQFDDPGEAREEKGSFFTKASLFCCCFAIILLAFLLYHHSSVPQLFKIKSNAKSMLALVAIFPISLMACLLSYHSFKEKEMNRPQKWLALILSFGLAIGSMVLIIYTKP